MRLIEAEELINILEWNKKQEKDALVSINSLIKLIKERPTAYDVDKVIEQLEDEQDYAYASFEEYAYEKEIDEEQDFFSAGMSRAIEIVKGGINELD